MKYVGLLFVFLIVLIIGVTESAACSCRPSPTVLDEFEKSDIVTIVRFDGMAELQGTTGYSQGARMTVEKIYKGGLAIDEEIIVPSGGGGDCTYNFSAEKTGQRFLVFTRDPRLYKTEAKSEFASKVVVYPYSICSRSKRFEKASTDLNYLDNRKHLEGKTRLTGTMYARGENPPSVANIKLRVVGSGIQRTSVTDEDGFFEFWDLPPGEYGVSYELPSGWKIAGFRVIPDVPVTNLPLKDGDVLLVKARIEAQKHTEVTVYLEIDNQIGGKVISPTGIPMKGVCVSAYWLTPTTSSFRIPDDCSDENGNFSIASLPPGNYRLEVNSRGAITKENPFATFYYPGVSKKEDAEVVSIGAGTQIRDLIIKVEKTLPLITISGRLTFRNGKPFPEEDVIFQPDDEFRYSRVEVETDENGNFSFVIAQGASGKVSATTNLHEIRFDECPAVKDLQKSRTGRAADVGVSLKISGEESQELKLALAVPYCKPVD